LCLSCVLGAPAESDLVISKRRHVAPGILSPSLALPYEARRKLKQATNLCGCAGIVIA
jgi:hypothetical protein